MKVLLHGVAKHEFFYTGFVDAVGEKNVLRYVPRYSYGKHKTFDENAEEKEKEMMEDLDSFDLIVLSRLSFLDRNLSRILNHKTSATKIFIDIEDYSFIRSIYRHKEIKYYYKREVYPDRKYITNRYLLRYLYGMYIHTPFFSEGISMLPASLRTLALPYALSVKTKNMGKLLPFPVTVKPQRTLHVNKKHKRYDLSAILRSQKIKERRLIYQHLEQLRERHKERKMYLNRTGVPKDEYLRILSESKVSVSVRGYGYDSFRYWEIPAYGAALLSMRMPQIVPHNFVDLESALFYDSTDELDRKFEKYVINSDEWYDIAKAGQALFFKHHTPRKRVEELILKRIK